MSAHGAAAAAGCCCRATEGCLCTDPARPGAAFDSSLSSVSADLDISVSHATYNNVVPGPCPGTPCYCSPDFQVGIYGYQKRGSSVDPDADCYGPGNQFIPCPTNSCDACTTYSINGSRSSSVLLRWLNGTQFFGAQFASRTVNLLDHSMGQWTWLPQQVGYCESGAVRVRRHCAFPYGIGGGLRLGVRIDPNGQYINDETGEYTVGRFTSNIGRVSAIIDVSVGYSANYPCSYEARVGIGYLSIASLFDAIYDTDGFLVGGGGANSYVASWTYLKPCRGASDNILGTYALSQDTPADMESYSEFQPCGRSHAYDDFRATAGDTLVIS